jgi:hypothetical protein
MGTPPDAVKRAVGRRHWRWIAGTEGGALGINRVRTGGKARIGIGVGDGNAGIGRQWDVPGPLLGDGAPRDGHRGDLTNRYF